MPCPGQKRPISTTCVVCVVTHRPCVILKDLVATNSLSVRCSRETETESRAKRSWKAIGAACSITIIVPCTCAPYMHKVKDVFYLPSKRSLSLSKRRFLLLIVAKVKDVLYGVKSGFPPFPRKVFGGGISLSVLQKIEPSKTRPLIWRACF